MEKDLKITLLYDIYGKNLTLKQQEIFEEYFVYDLSLREIAQNKSISYQAVRDSISTSKNQLLSFEKNIGMLQLLENVKKAYIICKDSTNLNDDKEKLLKLLK